MKFLWKFERKTLEMIAAYFVFAYILNYPPFMFQSVLDSFSKYPRILIEFATLLLLTILSVRHFFSGLMGFIAVWTACAIFQLTYCQPDQIASVISSFNKLLFASLIFNVMISSEIFRQKLIKLWTYFGWYIIGSGFLYYAFYVIGLKVFFIAPPDGPGVFSTYEYSINPFLGAAILKNIPIFRDGTLPRFTSWFIEPGQFSFLMAMNLVLGQYFYPPGRKRYLFLFGNLLVAILTFSVSFFAALAGMLFLYFMGSKSRSVRLSTIVVGAVLAVTVISVMYLPSFDRYTSGGERLMRASIALDYFENSPLEQIFFGTGPGSIVQNVRFGASTGYLNLLIERGLICGISVLMFVMFVGRKTPQALVIILIYLFTLSTFDWPEFWALLAIMTTVPMTRPSEALEPESEYLASPAYGV